MIERNNRIVLLLSFFLLVSSVFTNLYSDIKKLEDIFEELGFFMEGIGDFDIQKSILREEKEQTFLTVVAGRDGRVVKIEVIENINDTFVHRYIGEKKYAINSLYKRIPSPYPGTISNIIECPDELKPEVEYIEVEGELIPIYLLWSTPRFTYGATVGELVKYRVALVFIYSTRRKMLYQIELFIPKEHFDKKEVLTIFESFKNGN